MLWSRKVQEKDIFSALQTVHDPATQNDIVSLNWVSGVVVQNNHVLVTLEVDPAQGAALESVRQKAEQTLTHLRGVKTARVILTAQKPPAVVEPMVEKTRAIAPQVKNIIAVASGKGGVGKSTVAANLAVAMAKSGLHVGLLDADIYGPSVPTLMGLRHQKPTQEDDYIVPLQAHGVTVMSMGFLIEEEAPVIWRGPMIQKSLQQLLRDVRWGELDVLIVDMPPGTGDAQLTLAQKVPLKGAVIVSTPQDIALLDAVKGVQMFQKLNVPILGIVENMSVFCCPNCGHATPIFGADGAKKRAAELNVPFLGGIPLEASVRELSDKGTPVALQESHAADLFKSIADQIWKKLSVSQNQ